MNLISTIKNLFKYKPNYKIGDIWVAGNTDWVITSINYKKRSVELIDREFAFYSSKHKAIINPSLSGTPLPNIIIKLYFKVCSFKELEKKYLRCPNNQNFLEIDVLLDNKTI
jgi:hypothetical protein